ncbi:MAG TPA: SURF1 family protein [Cryptosporangiaceae bacterium]|nr:SURF1 family protein [Cryptosporangiaceae bacterium]
MYRFLLRPAWLGSFALCVVLAVVFVRLGLWQLDRREQRLAVNATVAAARDEAPRPAEAVLSASAAPAERDRYTHVIAAGRYDPAHEYLVRGRSVGNRAGLLVLTPLVTTTGTVLLVVRGFVPASSRGADVAPTVPAPPVGGVTVVGRVRAPEDGGDRAVRIGGTTQIARIDVDPIERDLGRPVYRAYVELVRQEPPAGDALTLLPALNAQDQGPHLSYAVQWFLFAALAFVGYGILARRRAHPLEGPSAWPQASERDTLIAR